MFMAGLQGRAAECRVAAVTRLSDISGSRSLSRITPLTKRKQVSVLLLTPAELRITSTRDMKQLI
jgi:hypothetical protein